MRAEAPVVPLLLLLTTTTPWSRFDEISSDVIYRQKPHVLGQI
jgi:hypothetical protein